MNRSYANVNRAGAYTPADYRLDNPSLPPSVRQDMPAWARRRVYESEARRLRRPPLRSHLH